MNNMHTNNIVDMGSKQNIVHTNYVDSNLTNQNLGSLQQNYLTSEKVVNTGIDQNLNTNLGINRHITETTTHNIVDNNLTTGVN